MKTQNSKTLTGLCLLATLVLATTARGDFNYPHFGSVAGLTLQGDAAQNGNVLRLTRPVAFLAADAWYETKQQISGGFETTFTFRITPTGFSAIADGIAFILQNHSATAAGTAGGGKGYAGIPACIAVEFDTWNGDLSIQSKGILPNTYTADATLATTGLPWLIDENVHTAHISYSGGVLSVYIDDLVNSKLSLAVDLSALLNLTDGLVWAGLGAGTGEGYETHEILSWSLATSGRPWVQTTPASQTVGSGANVAFGIAAFGTQPLSYQWRSNGITLLGMTNSSLLMPNVQANQAGIYSVLVSNSFGSTNVAATLSVLDLKMFAGLILAGPVGTDYLIEYRNALGGTNTWQTLTNVTLTASPTVFFDLNSPGYGQRYYRATPTP